MSLANQAITNFNDGNKLYKVNLFVEALEQYKSAIDNDPTFYNAHFCLAKTYLRLKRYEEANTYFKKYVHLIPKDKQGEYLMAFSNILVEEQQSEKALHLIKEMNISFNAQGTIKYANLLLKNNKVSDALHQLFQLEPSQFGANEYQQLSNDKGISAAISQEFTKNNTIPKFFSAQKRLALLQKAEIKDQDLKGTLDNANALVDVIRSTVTADYSTKMSELESELLKAQHLVFQHAKTLLKSNKKELSKRVLSTLKASKFDEDKISELEGDIKAFEKKKAKARIKKTALVSILVILLSVASYFGYNYYKQTEAFNNAIASKSLYKYNNYLNRFGDHDEIHKLREAKLYDIAVNSNKSSDINTLVNLYPESDKLHTVTFKNINSDIGLQFFGIQSDNNLNTVGSKPNSSSFKVPNGCKLGFKLNQYGKLPIEKYFTANQDLIINEQMLDAETVLLHENFDTNAYNWKQYTKKNESKYAANRIKEAIAFKDGILKLESETGNTSLVYSLIDVVDFDDDFDFRITTSVNTTKYFTNGTYLMFGASNRAFLYFGYSGAAVNGSYVIGHNNWDDANNNWKNWTNSWQRAKNAGYDVLLKVEKKNNKLHYFVNNQEYKSYPLKRFYGKKIGFGINGGTKSSVSFLKVERLNKPKRIDFKANNTYFCWVKELNVRDTSSKGDIITTISLGDPVMYLGEVGTKQVNATFRDQSKPDFYYKVKLIDGTIGWVHGGALCDIQAVDFKNNLDLKAPEIQAIDTKPLMDSLETLEIVDYKHNYFMIGEDNNMTLNTFKSIDDFLETTKYNITKQQLETINGAIHQTIGDTIYVSEAAFAEHKNPVVQTRATIDEVMPFDFVERSPTFGKCSGTSNTALKKCFAKNLTKHLNKETSIKHYQTLGLSNGMKEAKYSFTISKEGLPTNIKVWANHDAIESDIQSIITRMNDFSPGYHEGNPIAVTYNGTYTFRIGKKPKQAKPSKTVVVKEEEKEPEVEPIPMPKNLTFYTVDRAPVFPGCEGTSEAIMFTCSKKKINNYVLEHIDYNKLAVIKEKAYAAKVEVSFKVSTSGTIKNTVVTCNSEIDAAIKTSIIKEVKAVVNSIPVMKPALLSDEPVEVSFSLTLNLKI